MNHHKVVVGGFASDKRQIHTVAEKLSEYYDQDVVGVNFREARQYPERLANFISDKEVITHSAGFVAVQNVLREWSTKPRSITAIAPPIPESIGYLVWRGFRMGSSGVTDRLSSIRDELVYHAKSNFGALPIISRFNALDAAVWDVNHDIDTTVAVMSQDKLFPSGQYADDIMGRELRVIGLHGEHLRFSYEPVDVMSEIALAQTVKLTA